MLLRLDSSNERKVFSQNGEDGLIDEIFKSIGVTNRVFVEIGVGDGLENNTLFLARQGWSGYWFSPGVPAANVPSTVKYHNGYVLPCNANKLFNDIGVPNEFDLLSIDIDGEDYWVWESLPFNPRVVIIEYNASYPPPDKRTIPYNPTETPFVWDGTNYYGASISALTNLAESKGYSFVGCNGNGVNALFVKKELVSPQASLTDVTGYRPVGYGGHPNSARVLPLLEGK